MPDLPSKWPCQLTLPPQEALHFCILARFEFCQSGKIMVACTVLLLTTKEVVPIFIMLIATWFSPVNCLFISSSHLSTVFFYQYTEALCYIRESDHLWIIKNYKCFQINDLPLFMVCSTFCLVLSGSDWWLSSFMASGSPVFLRAPHPRLQKYSPQF